MDIAALKRDLEGLKIEDNPKLVQQKSRDFYWYSPVLKRQLDAVTGDLVVTPRSEAEVVRVLAACHRHGVPVTPRGSGTGNYGQAMPLSGGVLPGGCDHDMPVEDPSPAPGGDAAIGGAAGGVRRQVLDAQMMVDVGASVGDEQTV